MVDGLRAVPVALWLLLGLALVLRLVIIRYGLPQEFDPDEEIFVRAALRMIRVGSLDPDWYGQPGSTLIDGLAALYAAHGLLGVLSGGADQVSAVFGDYRDDVSHVFMVGRVFTAIVGVIGLAVVYAIAVEIRIAAFWSGVAVLILAISALMIRYASTIRADMLQILFVLLILWIMARSLSRPTATSFVLAGACLGFAVTSKYPGLVGVVPIVAAATTLVLDRLLTARKAFLWLAMAAIASVVTAVLAGPYLFINLQGALEALTVEARPEALGATSNGFVWALWSYVTEALPEGLGPVGTVLGVVGAVVMLGDRQARLVGLTFWAYLVSIALLSLWWERWVLPLVPMAALGIAYLVAVVEAKTRARLAGRAEGRRLIAARLVVAALILLPLVVPTIDLVRGRATNDDTRVVAERWVEANVPLGATLLIETYTPSLRSDRYDLLIARDGELVRWQAYRNQRRPGGFYGSLGDHWCRDGGDLPAAIAEHGVDYILISDSFIDRYDAERERYPCEWAVYQELLATYPVIAVFDRDDAALGDTVRVLQVGDPQEAASPTPSVAD